MLRSQFRAGVASLPANGMALDTFLLEDLPSSLGTAPHLAPVRRRCGRPSARVGDQVVHFATGELGPLTQGFSHWVDHGLGVVPHGACPGAGASRGRDAREFWGLFTARRTNGMTADATFPLKHALRSEEHT